MALTVSWEIASLIGRHAWKKRALIAAPLEFVIDGFLLYMGYDGDYRKYVSYAFHNYLQL